MHFLYISFFCFIFHSYGQTVFKNERLERFADVRDCQELLQSFANSTSNFTYCAIHNARPIKICQKCVGIYEEVISIYDKILQEEDDSGNVCKTILMNLDRLQVIEQEFNLVTTLWDNANCEYCFTKNDSDTGKRALSNDTVKFFELMEYAEKCIGNYSLGNGTYNATVCTGCEKEYCDCNQFYDKLKESQEGKMCMDVVDSMNITRVLWSGKLACVIEHPKATDVIFLCCIGFFAILPLIFYSGASFSTQARNKIMHFPRLKESRRPPSLLDNRQPSLADRPSEAQSTSGISQIPVLLR